MSVLAFPRIYFNGYLEWDPCTFNNNDFAAFPTYDPLNAGLNWSFLGQFGITPDNFETTFRPWAIKLQPDTNPADPEPGTDRIPCEWNMFGSHSVSFVQYQTFQSLVTGGALGPEQPVTDDPLIGGPVAITGDGGRGSARLVDTNPASPWSTQVYWGGFSVGGSGASLSGKRAYRLQSRWLNPNRMVAAGDALLAPASGIGVTFQTGIPNDKLDWSAAASSPLLQALQKAASQPRALGVMVRFVGYVNAYFSNGILNGNAAQPRNYNDLAAALAAAWKVYYDSGGKDTSQFFSNPCYSHVVGVVGVWNDGELASVPGGRCLNGNVAVAPRAKASAAANQPAIVGHQVRPAVAAAAPAPVMLGPVSAQIDYDKQLISLDLSATMPEVGEIGTLPYDLAKANFGPLQFGVVDAAGNFNVVATIDYAQYAKAPYQASAGIVDIPFPGPYSGPALRDGQLAIRVAQPNASPAIALLETPAFTAETDRRGIYLDQGEETTFEIMVCERGVPAPNVNVLVARYDGFSKSTMQATGLPIIATSAPQQVNFTTGTQQTISVPNPNTPPPTNIDTGVTVVQTGADGKATVGISAQSPSFPVLGFYPYRGATPPQPNNAFNFTDNAYYTTIRVLPFNDDLPQVFVNLWNQHHDPQQAWELVYHQILYLYDMLFNVMLTVFDLGSREQVEANIPGIWALTSKEAAAEGTMAMPITRDLSAGKRLTLQLWMYLAAQKYDVANLTVGSIPAGWTPGKK